MKIAPARIEGFVKQPPAAVRVALIYGPDHGAVRLRGETLARSIVTPPDDPFRVTLLTSEAIADDATTLYDAMASHALGGGRCLVRVLIAEDKIAAALTHLLKDVPPTEHFLLLEAGDLDKKSKLRSVAESDNEAIAAVACYPETGQERSALIAAWLREQQQKIEPDALALLSDLTPPDRLGLFSELEKLSLYADKTPITTEMVMAALGDAAAVDMEAMVLAVGAGDRAALVICLQRLAAENTSPVAMLRAAQRHFNRLLETRVRMDEGVSLPLALGKLFPPVFYKTKEAFTKQVQRWPQNRLLHALAMLTTAEAQCKRTGIPDQALCQQLLLSLAIA